MIKSKYMLRETTVPRRLIEIAPTYSQSVQPYIYHEEFRFQYWKEHRKDCRSLDLLILFVFAKTDKKDGTFILNEVF